VVGAPGEPAALNEFTPSAAWAGFFPEAGLPDHGHLVTVILLVRDARGAVSFAALNITVETPSSSSSATR